MPPRSGVCLGGGTICLHHFQVISGTPGGGGLMLPGSCPTFFV